MVNQAMADMVTAQHGEPTWQRITRRAGCDVDHFVRMDAYDDALTYGLVSAAVVEFGVPAADLLRAFGGYWVSYALRSGYEEFFRAAPGYQAFLTQLDAMHARLQLSFKGLRAPQFSCTTRSERELEVVYRSHRSGLAPFVAGLLEGLGPVFGVKASVTHERGLEPGAAGAEDHFLVVLSVP